MDNVTLSQGQVRRTTSEWPSAGLGTVLFEGDARNRWRDGPVCPAVDKELWRLGPDGLGVFWRVMRQ
ncbi:hypothetical protein TNCV_5112761 [Trichonephila clavipes]|nr:hypothetical protein TNCV_5112761 [Trichonephila clavipes]